MTPTTRTVLLIAGMRGNRCRENIAEALESVAGVRGVGVNLFRAEATILHAAPCETSTLINTVLGAGYGVSLADPPTRDKAKSPPARPGSASASK